MPEHQSSEYPKGFALHYAVGALTFGSEYHPDQQQKSLTHHEEKHCLISVGRDGQKDMKRIVIFTSHSPSLWPLWKSLFMGSLTLLSWIRYLHHHGTLVPSRRPSRCCTVLHRSISSSLSSPLTTCCHTCQLLPQNFSGRLLTSWKHMQVPCLQTSSLLWLCIGNWRET